MTTQPEREPPVSAVPPASPLPPAVPVPSDEPVPPAPLQGPPLLIRRGAFLLVLTLLAASVALTLLADFRIGGYTLALAALTGAAARAFLPEYLCLGLLVRSRRQDVVTLLLLGAAVAVSAHSVPGP